MTENQISPLDPPAEFVVGDRVRVIDNLGRRNADEDAFLAAHGFRIDREGSVTDTMSRRRPGTDTRERIYHVLSTTGYRYWMRRSDLEYVGPEPLPTHSFSPGDRVILLPGDWPTEVAEEYYRPLYWMSDGMTGSVLDTVFADYYGHAPSEVNVDLVAVQFDETSVLASGEWGFVPAAFLAPTDIPAPERRAAGYVFDEDRPREIFTTHVRLPESDMAARRTETRMCEACHGEFNVDHFLWGTCLECGQASCYPRNACCNVYSCGDAYEPECDDDEPYGRGVFNYSYKPTPKFFGGEPINSNHPDKSGTAPYHIGLELEVSGSSSDDVTPLYDWAKDHGMGGLFYCKEDGSVEGFEIVTHPMTAEYARTADWAGFFDFLNTEYPLYRNTEPSGHGLHIHVSRTAFPTMLDACRWAYLIHGAREEVERIARRSSPRWSKWAAEPVTDAAMAYVNSRPPAAVHKYALGGEAKKIHRGARYLDRYMTLNHTNGATIEVRAFRSTRNVAEFRAAIELILSSVDYVREVRSAKRRSVDSLAWSEFSAWALTASQGREDDIRNMIGTGVPTTTTRARDSRGRFVSL